MMGGMRTFTDFDAWGEAVSGADLRLACNGMEHPVWQLAATSLGSVMVQAAYEGGGNLCYGGNNSGGIVLFLPLTLPEHHVANCEPLDEASLLAIPSGCDFSIRVQRRAHAWCSVALPAEMAGPRAADRASSWVVRSDSWHVRRLKDLVTRIVANPLLRGQPAAIHANAAASLTAAVRTCLEASCDSPIASAAPRIGRPRIDRREIIRRVQIHLEANPFVRPSVAALADVAGVTDRTLCRAFQDTFGTSPLQYMTLRLLHRVRQTLLLARGDTTVARVLVGHGIWEFGRFATRYRRQFGESLSDTLARAGG